MNVETVIVTAQELRRDGERPVLMGRRSPTALERVVACQPPIRHAPIFNSAA